MQLYFLAAACVLVLQDLLVSGSKHSHVDIDLDIGVVTGYSDRVQFLTTPSTSAQKTRCGRQAVVRVELGGAVQVVQLALKYNIPRLWTLHISDSLLAEGYGSPSNSSTMTEIQVVNQQLRVYTEWPSPNTAVSVGDGDGPGIGTSHSQWMFLRVVDETVRKHSQMELTLTLHSNSFRWQDGRLAQDFSAPPGLFYQHGVLRDKVLLYVSMNRIIAGDWRYGTGLCQVTLKLMQNEEECNASEMGCDPNAICKLTRRGYRCSCKKGWQGNGKICKDINECLVRDGGCVHKCHNIPGSYRCSCHPGFSTDPEDLHNCLDIDECSTERGGCDQECVNTIGSYECRCSKGGFMYTTNQKHCRSGNIVCMNNGCHQTCELSHNMRIKACSCWPNYQINTTDGKSCDRTCRIGNGGCHHHCHDTETGPICTCHHKYLLGLDVHSCAASCAVNNGGCQKRCTNTNVGVSCICPNGYNLNEDKKSCSDIDECTTANGGCQYQCVNNVGSYECICPAGYKLNPVDEKTCVDNNECEHNITCEHICINTPGSFRCECHHGYQLYGVSHCGDIDECFIRNGGCPKVCINTEGSFHCSSNDADKLLANSKECVDAYIASSKFLLTGVAYGQTNNIKAYGQRIVVELEEIGIKDCEVQCHKLQSMNSKRILNKYGKVEGEITQITMDIICKTMNSTSLCDQQCGVTKTTQALCKTLALLKETLVKPFSIKIDNNTASIIQKSFKVRQIYMRPCHSKGERTRIQDICKEDKMDKAVAEQGTSKLYNKLESNMNKQIKNVSTNIEHCVPGTFWESISKTCEFCMKNTYQENPGQISCSKCPENTATDETGSRSVNDCKGEKCKNYVNELSGFIESPNYPGHYPSNADCTWILKPPKRRRLLIIVPEISLAGEKCEDHLVMRKSRSPYSVVTFEACKSIKKPIAFTAQSRTLWMHFQSDGHNNSRGFHIPFVTYNGTSLFLLLLLSILRSFHQGAHDRGSSGTQYLSFPLHWTLNQRASPARKLEMKWGELHITTLTTQDAAVAFAPRLAGIS